MSDANLMVGGKADPSFPNCDGSRNFKLPFPRRVAYEYATGTFTLGWPLYPSEEEYQYNELQAANPVVGDHIMMYIVPERHLLTSVAARVDIADAAMAGATLKPSAMLYDSVAGTYTELPLLDAMFDPLSLIATGTVWAPVKTSQTFGTIVTTDAPYFVNKGQTLILTFKVVAVPTDTSVGIKDFAGKMSLVAKVEGFDIPTEM